MPQPRTDKLMTIDLRRVARALSAVENRRPEAEALLRRGWSLAQPAPVLGVAGPPGAGKSTLVDHLALHWAEAGERVAVVAIDPSSPYSGGAVLGDRFRMDHASAHPRVFVRSLSARGHVGGLSRAAQDIVVALGALDFDRVLVETVGSGQSDVEVAQLADCVVVVSVPGLGDQVQAAKAGILEIGDVYAVNKADLPGANAVAGHLDANLNLIYPGQAGVNEGAVRRCDVLAGNAALHERHGTAGVDVTFWRPPVLRVVGRDGIGVTELASACDAFLAWQRDSGREPRRRAHRRRHHLLRLVVGRLLQRSAGGRLRTSVDEQVRALEAGECLPDEAADAVIGALYGAWHDQR